MIERIIIHLIIIFKFEVSTFPIVVIFFLWLCAWGDCIVLNCRFHIYIYNIPGKLGFVSFITVQFDGVCKLNTLRLDGRIHLFALTLPPYHHYADVSEGIELLKYLSHILSSVCLRFSKFAQLSFMQYTFSLPIFPMMIVRICELYLNIITIKFEMWPICHCSGLSHETMVSAVCLYIYT